MFYEWLDWQAPRNDVIGDLAKYLSTDLNIQYLDNTFDEWLGYLKSRAASPIKLIALRFAWCAYLRTPLMHEASDQDLPVNYLTLSWCVILWGILAWLYPPVDSWQAA